jgi:hypothetical protein
MDKSAFVKIDRLYENEMRARARDAEKDRQIISSDVLDFFKQMTGFENLIQKRFQKLIPKKLPNCPISIP